MSDEQNTANEPEEQQGAATGYDIPGESVDLLKDPARRLFFKRAAVGGGAACPKAAPAVETENEEATDQ